MASALAYLDPGEFGGALKATPTGFEWTWVVSYREPSTNKKDVVSGVKAFTLDSDTLVQVRDKIVSAIVSDGSFRGYSVTTVLLPAFQVISV